MNYQSPLMDLAEIISAFQQCHINLTETDLKHPDPRRWREIYGQMFESLTSISIEQASQSVCRPGMMKADYHELYDEGFAQLAFTLCMHRVLCECGFRNFSVKDIIGPQPKRCMHIASNFINMTRHGIIRDQVISDMNQDIEQSRDEYESAFKRHAQLKHSLDKANETTQQRDAQMQQNVEDMEQAEQQFIELTKQQEVIQKYVDDLNVCSAEKVTLKDSIKQFIAAEQQTAEKLSNKIVQSPEKFKQEQERLKNRILELKGELASKEQVVSENRNLMEQTENKMLTAEKTVKLSKEIHEDSKKEIEFSSKMHCVKESVHELYEIYNNLWAQMEDLAEKLTVRYEQKRKIVVQTDVSKSHLHQRLTENRQYLMKLDDDVKSLHAEKSKIKQEDFAIIEDFSYVEETLEEKKTTWKADYSEMLNEIDILHTLTANGVETVKNELLD